MTVLASLAIAAALYAWGVARVRRAGRAFPLGAVAAFAAALVIVGLVLLGPIDALADASLAWHMLQHLALIGLAAPLLLLGAPHRLALAALPQRQSAALAGVLNAAPLRWIAHPAVAWLQLTLVLYGTHFSPLYEAALEHPPIHALEHALYLGSGLIFWAAILAVAPAPHAPSHPARILMLFLALPMSAFLGFAFYVARNVLYAHYAAQPGARADQANAGAVMWLAGGVPLFLAMLWCVADWGRREARLDAISDAMRS